MGQPVDVLDQRPSRNLQRRVQLEHADKIALTIDYRQVPPPVTAHVADRFVQVVVDPDGEDRGAHDRLHRLIPAGEPAYDVLLGDNAQDAAVLADDHRRRGTHLGHAANDFSRARAVLHHERGGAICSPTMRRNIAVGDAICPALLGSNRQLSQSYSGGKRTAHRQLYKCCRPAEGGPGQRTGSAEEPGGPLVTDRPIRMRSQLSGAPRTPRVVAPGAPYVG